jgi:hypothetical protein
LSHERQQETLWQRERGLRETSPFVLRARYFTDYGHITLEKDKLDAKAFALMKELIGLGFLQVTPT